jgi:O-antigen/teichoic acid export membrane protein
MEKQKVAAHVANQEKMAQGSTWMTVGNIVSRLLGAIYIIPWYAWMGTHAKAANGLFNMGYNFYALFLMISTAGIPSAIAKQVSKYNSLHQYKNARALFYHALRLMLAIGLFFAIVMWALAPWLAKLSGGGAELIPVIRSLSIAILAFPCMSVIRGYFQGNQDMRPFALSQVFEQIVRVFYMLFTAFVIMKLFRGEYTTAVVQSTFAAFVGMLGSFVVLAYYLRKLLAEQKTLVDDSDPQDLVSAQSMMFETLRESVPFVILGAGVTIFKLVDQVTFISTMEKIGSYSHLQLVNLYSIFSANPDKLTMVIIALATSISMTGLPMITAMMTQKNTKALNKLISDNLQLFAFIMLPATLGMILLAHPLNTLFYGPDDLGAKVLIEACFAAIPTGLFMVVGSFLAGMYKNQLAMISFIVGFLLKIILQIPLIHLFEVYGPLIATIIGFTVTSIMLLRQVHHVTKFRMKLMSRRLLLIVILTLFMWVVAFVVRQFGLLILDQNSRSQAFVIVMATAAAGGYVYLYLALKIRLVDKLLGSMGKRLRKKLHIR